MTVKRFQLFHFFSYKTRFTIFINGSLFFWCNYCYFVYLMNCSIGPITQKFTFLAFLLLFQQIIIRVISFNLFHYESHILCRFFWRGLPQTKNEKKDNRNSSYFLLVDSTNAFESNLVYVTKN